MDEICAFAKQEIVFAKSFKSLYRLYDIIIYNLSIHYFSSIIHITSVAIKFVDEILTQFKTI